MKAHNLSKELRSDQAKLNGASISFQLSDTKRSKGEARGKKVRLIEQLDLDRLGQTIDVSHNVPRQRGDKENHTRAQSRHRKRLTDERVHSTFRRRKNSSNVNEDGQQTRSKLQTRRSNPEVQRLGKSLDYKRYLNKSMLPPKQSKSQSCSPRRKKSVSKQNKRFGKPFPTAKTRPSSVRTSSQTVTLSTLLNTKFNKTDNSNRLRELLNSMKNEQSGNLREILENSFETKIKDVETPVEKRDSSRKLRTKKKSADIRRKHASTTVSKMDFDVSLNATNNSKADTKKFIRKKPLEEVYEDANIDDDVDQAVLAQSSYDNLINKISSESHKQSTPIYVENEDDVELVKVSEQDEINISEIRDFQHMSYERTSARPPRLKEQHHESSLLREVMAQKIQRAWREYRTRKLLIHYIDMFRADSEYEKTDSFDMHGESGSEILMRVGRRQIGPDQLESESVSSESPGRKLQYDEADFCKPRLEIGTQEFYQQRRAQDPKVTVVSQLGDMHQNERQISEAGVNNQIERYESIIKSLRQEELKKWSSIVEIISRSLKEGRTELDAKELLKKIAEQSEENKEKLEQQVLLKSEQSSLSLKHFHSLEQQKSEGLSENDPFQEFNSRKYKELLDPTIVENLIKSRQRFLSERQKTEMRLIADKYQTDQISIGSYKRNRERIEKWVSAEKVSIQKTRRDIEMGLGKAKQAIKKTQLDYVIMLKLKSSPAKPLHKCQSDQGLSRLRFNRRKPEDSVSLTSSQNQYENYINNASFEEYQGEDVGSNTERLKQKLQRLNQHEERSPPSDKSSESERVLRRQTNEPLHKMHFDLSQHNYSELCSISDREPEDHSTRIAKLISQSIDPDKLSQEVCKEVFDELLMSFLKDVSIHDSIIQNFKLLKNFKPQRRRQKGIRTNITSVREQSMRNEEKKFDLLKLLERPSGPTAREMLKFMHYYEDEQIREDQLNEEEEVQNTILQNSVFQQHWKEIQGKIEFEPYYPQPEKEKARVDYLKGLTRIHYLAIFEVYNQCLQQERNFGTFGEPFPWKKVPNFFHEVREPVVIKKVLDSVARKINSIATSFCGIIFDREDCTVEYSEDYIAQIQEDRVTRMLALEVMQGEHRWLFYDDEEAEILVEVAYLINEALVNELVLELHQMMFLR